MLNKNEVGNVANGKEQSGNRFSLMGVNCGVQSCDLSEANVFYTDGGITRYARLIDGEFTISVGLTENQKDFFQVHKTAFAKKVSELCAGESPKIKRAS
jgi:hypothetical protein